MKYTNLTMKKRNTLSKLIGESIVLLVLLLFGGWSVSIKADTETQPSSATSNADIVGTSYTFAGTYNAGNGSTKVTPMTSKGVKVRTNKAADTYSNALKFAVNDDYQISGITIVGVTNTKGKAATLGSVYVDGELYTGSYTTTLAARDGATASTISITGIAATTSVIFVFSDLNGTSQANIEWTIDYTTVGGGGGCTAPTCSWATAPADGAIGGSMTASVTTNYAAGLTWTSSDATVASLTGTGTSRTINYLKAGTTTITASVTGDGTTYCDDEAVTASQLITVTAPIAVTGVTLNKSTLELYAGLATGKLTATVAPADATNKGVSWTTSDASVATVADGIVTPVAAGTATITVTTDDGSFTATCEVTVTTPVMGENEVVPAYVSPVSNWYEHAGVGRISNKTGAAFASPDVTTCSPTGFKTGSSNFTIQTYKAIIGVVVHATSSSNRTISTVKTGAATGSLSTLTVDDDYTVTGSVVKNDCDNTFTILFTSTLTADQYINITASGNFDVISVEFLYPCDGPTNTSPAFAAATYDMGDVATSFTATGTPSDGGTLSFKWYQNTTASKTGAVEAAGTNNLATYTPSTELAGTTYYYCVITESGCAVTAETALSGAIVVNDPCNSWGQSTLNTDLISEGDIVVGDLTISGEGSIGVKSVSPFSGSGTLAYIITPNSASKVIHGTLGGKKIGTVKIGASTTSTSATNNTLYIAFSSANTFSTDALIDYVTDIPYHVFEVPANTAAKDIVEITAPSGAKSFEIGRNGPAADVRDGTLYTSNDRYVYYLSVCESDDCTPDFSLQPIDNEVDAGASVTLSVNSADATGYQWYRNTTQSTTGATLIPSATAKTYSPSTASAGVTYYYCVISKSGCPTTNTSDIVAVTVLQGCADEAIISATLTSNTAASISGTIGGTTQLSLPSTKDGDGGYKLGSNSQYFFVTLDDGNFQAGDVVKLTITTAGGGGKVYFYSNNSADKKIAEVAATTAGTYSYTLTASDISTYGITNKIGTFRENSDNNPFVKTLSVERLICHACPQPTIGSQPTDAQYCSGSTVALTVGSITGGTTPYTYQWYKDGEAIPSATSATYNASAAGAYQCKVSTPAGCYVRSSVANVTGLTAVTASWATTPADAAVGAPNMTAAVTTNYADGLVWTSDKPLIASVTSEGEIAYLAEGTATITATVTGVAGDGYCGTEVLSKTITIAAPSCTSYSFHWGASVGAEDNLICFTQKGTSTTYLSSLFTVPTANNAYYVGWQGYWNTTNANSANAYMTGMKYAHDPSKTLTRAEAGNVGGAQGYLRVYSDSSDPNKYVGFIPAGYGMRVGTDEPIALLPKSADIEENDWQSELVELTADMLLTTTKYDVRLKTSDSYVWAEGRSQESTIKGMKIRNGASTFRATNIGDADAGLYGKFAIFANSGDANWYCYFIPYWGINFNLNGGEAWAGEAPDRVSVEGNDAARTVTLPSELPIRKGYHFLGWDTNSAATTPTYEAGDDVVLTSDITLYAIWEEITLSALECDGSYRIADIAAAGALSGTHYESGFSTNEKFYIIGDETVTDAADGTPEQKSNTKQTVNSIDFTNFMYLKGAAELDGEGIPTSRAVKFIVPQDGKLTIYYRYFDRAKLLKEGDDEGPVNVGESNNGSNSYGWYTHLVEAGTYYIYGAAASAVLLGIDYECCPTLAKYAVSASKASMCPGDDATITLAGSETGVDYQLYLDGEEEQDAKAGTGSALTWTVSKPGTYTVKTSTDCLPVAMTGSAVIANPGGNITGEETLMRTKSIVLTADKTGGVWGVSNANVTLSLPDETDGETSKVTVTGQNVGTVDVTYTLGGCESTQSLTVNPYQICYTFGETGHTSPYTMTEEGVDMTLVRLTNNSGAPDLAESTDIIQAGTNNYSGLYVLRTYQRIALKTSVATTEIKLYAHYNSSTARSISKISWSETGDDKSYTAYTKGDVIDWDVDFDSESTRRYYEITIFATDGNFIPANTYIWIEYSGTGLQTREICITPVNCSSLTVTPSRSTTLESGGPTLTLTASVGGGTWSIDDEDVADMIDNNNGTATVAAKSLSVTSTANITYTAPNGCTFVTEITVTADPCPAPVVEIYTKDDQILGAGAPLLLVGNATASPGTITYQWYSNTTRSTTGGTPVPSATFADFMTTTAAVDGDTYYYLAATNTVGLSSKTAYSDVILITTATACANQTIISADVKTGTNKVATEVEAEGSIGGSLLQKVQSDCKVGSNGHYVFLQLASGNFQAGDIVKITVTATPTKLFLATDESDATYIHDNTHYIDAAVGTIEYTLTPEDIANGVTNKIGIYRSSLRGQNPTITSMSVERPFCFTDRNTCLGEKLNTNLCAVEASTGYTYEWKINGGSVLSTSSSFTATATTANQTISGNIIKAGVVQATQTIKITGDQTAFTMNKTSYFKGETELLVPVGAGGVWTTSDPDLATVSADGLFTATGSNNLAVTITYTKDGCSNSQTVTVSNPNFIFTGKIDDQWGTVGNWYTEASGSTESVPTGILPTIENNVLIQAPCVVNIPNARGSYARIVYGSDGTKEYTGSLTIEYNGALTLGSTIQARIGDGTQLVTSPVPADKLRIESTSAGQGALAFIENTPANLPQATIVQYMKGYYDPETDSEGTASWQYMGTPFANPAINEFSYYGSWIQQWSESSESWSYLHNEDALTPFVGYAYTQQDEPSGKYYVNDGLLNQPIDKDITLSYTKKGAGKNLLANSWTAPIYINKMILSDFENIDDPVFYVFQTGSHSEWEAGNFGLNSVNTGGTDVEPAPGQYIAIPAMAAEWLGQKTIAPMQGFFVYATGANAVLHLNYERIVINREETTRATNPRRKPAVENTDIKKSTILVVGENGADEATILTGNDFTMGYDRGWDGRKIAGGQSIPCLSVLTAAGSYAVSAQPELLGTSINLRAGKDTEYTLYIITDEEGLMLKDMLTDSLIPITDTTIYHFTTTNKRTTTRFCIVKNEEVITNVENEYGGMLINAFVDGRELKVTNFTGESAQIRVYDVTGKLISAQTTKSEVVTLQVPTQGVYLVKINDQVFKVTF